MHPRIRTKSELPELVNEPFCLSPHRSFTVDIDYTVYHLLVKTGAHQMEPPSPIQALGVNPFQSRFIIRTVPRGDFARRRWEEPITTTK